MTITPSQKKAVAKYNALNYDRIELRVKKGKKQIIQDHAAAAGLSLNAFIDAAIDEKIEKADSLGAEI